MSERENKDEYLGDGVYASFDGYHINLAVNHHENHVVSLEPEVLVNFAEYVRKIYADAGVASPI